MTFATAGSEQVLLYGSIEEMKTYHEQCVSLGGVGTSFGVFMNSPWGRKRAARTRLKNVAHEKGANAVIMTSNDWGLVTDQVQGVAYRCGPE
jgi:uncharacterized protein YbjQ (UPF0145 family)